jgi:CBS domain containing-hemolysin-like protein
MAASWLGVVLALLFVALNGFFVAAEFALVKVRDTQLAGLARKGNARARRAREVTHRLESYLNATQLGITLSSLALGWIGEPALASKIAPLMTALGVESQAVVHTAAFAISFAVLSALHILFGELVPKSIGIRRALSTTLGVALPLMLFRWVFLPFLAAMDWLSNLVLRALGMPPLHGGDHALSEEEIRLMLESDQAKAELPERKRALIMRVLRSADRPVRLAMVPRVDVAYLCLEDPIERVREQARAHEFSRLPVVKGGDLDQIVGYVHVRDLLYDDGGSKSLEGVLRELLFTPESVTVAALLDRMSAERVHMAVVVDEHGGTRGLITHEDLIEEFVGEIQDEFDVEPASIGRLPDGSYRMQGSMALADVETHLRLEPSGGEPETLGAYIVARLGRLARPGDVVELGGMVAEVATVRRHRIGQVLLRARSAAAGDDPG